MVYSYHGGAYYCLDKWTSAVWASTAIKDPVLIKIYKLLKYRKMPLIELKKKTTYKLNSRF